MPSSTWARIASGHITALYLHERLRTITSVDVATRTITLNDGTRLSVRVRS